MTDTQTPRRQSGLVTGSRWVLTILAALLALGAFTQFFLVGVSFFDDAGRWNDHTMVGNTLSLVTWVMWVPAVLGKTGRRLIVGTITMFVVFGMQHYFIDAGNSMVNALHALNGTFVLLLACWITHQAVRSLRQPSELPASNLSATDRAAQPNTLERSTS